MEERHWAYNDIGIAYQAGYMQGSGGKAEPDRGSTRQEGAVMIAKLLGLDLSAAADLKRYHDGWQAASWSAKSLSALSVKGIFKGDTSGNLRPKDTLTRAQAITIIDAALTENREAVVFDKPGEYGMTDEARVIKGDVVIASDGVILVNTIIEGDLLLADGIGEGDVLLKQVTVRGTTTVKGGGPNSVHVEDSVLVEIIVDKAGGLVRIVASGASDIRSVLVQSPVKLEEYHSAADKGFHEVQLAKRLPAHSTVELIGRYENVSIAAASVKINIPQGSVEHLNIAEGAAHNTVRLDGGATIARLVLDAIAELAGQGTIVAATLGAGAKGSTFEKEPEKVEGPGQSEGTPPVIIPGGGGSSPGGGTAPPPVVDQTNSTLREIALGGALELMQRNDELATIGTGFASGVSRYTVALDRDMEQMNVPVTIKAVSGAATIDIIVMPKDRLPSRHVLTNDKAKFQVALRPLEDVQMQIAVTSGDGKNTSYYFISFQYERTVQDAFMIERYKPQFETKDRFSIHSKGVFEQGDTVELYESKAESEPFMATVVASEGEYVLEFEHTDYSLLPAGQLYIQVKREETVVMEGTFDYDLAELERIAAQDGLSVDILTNEERAAEYGPYDADYPYVIRLDFDPAKWAGTPLEKAKYYKTDFQSLHEIFYESETPLKYSNKVDANPFDSNINRVQEGKSYIPINNFGNKNVYDSYVQLIMLDENYQPIGYYEQALEPRAEHLSPGHHAVHSIRPEFNEGDTAAPVFTSELPSVITAGDQLHMNVSERANVYLVPAGTPLARGRDIHELVLDGMGKGNSTIPVDPYSAYLNSDSLAEGSWLLVAVDRSGNVSAPIPLEIVQTQEETDTN